jgi:hypothetical protein
MSNGDTPDDAISKRAAFYFRMFQVVGWPGTILVSLIVGVVITARSTAPYVVNVVDKVVNSHVETLRNMSEAQASIAKSQETSAKNSEQSNQILSEIKENQRTYSKTLIEHGELLHDIHDAVVSPKKKVTAGGDQ